MCFRVFLPVILTLFGYSGGRNTQQKLHGKKTKQLAFLPRAASHKIIQKKKLTLLKNPATDVHTATKVFWKKDLVNSVCCLAFASEISQGILEVFVQTASLV